MIRIPYDTHDYRTMSKFRHYLVCTVMSMMISLHYQRQKFPIPITDPSYV